MVVEIRSGDFANGFTYMGISPSEAGKEFVSDYVVISTGELVEKSKSEDYKSLARKFYRELPKNEGAIDLSKALVVHRTFLEDKV
ncbi:MAG: hypothetical protein WC548_01455 [Candidatus Pacearchaeota archaeon]